MFAASRTFVRTFTTSARRLNAPVAAAAEAAASKSTPSVAAVTESVVSRPLPKAYFIERTKSGQLPVYSEFRNAGSRALTIIRKIQGSALACKADLSETFPGLEVRVNQRSNQVILKGLAMDDIRQWLIAKGF
ncbi:54S ribosomal protein L49, mitochondrial [Gryganskiella cystojenkinii]|nr:54S ribosomal protein L49, mitochondrial [Gryganskiella cystojenkinii]